MWRLAHAFPNTRLARLLARIDDPRRAIERRGLFDARFYAAQCPDADAVSDPLTHYLEAGAAQGHSPHPWFDTVHYWSRYPDVRASALNPLVHFVTIGLFEGRSPHPDFDAARYLEANPDAAASGLPAFDHFLRYGQLDGTPTRPLACYDAWRRRHTTLSRLDREAISTRIARFTWQPRFSVVVASNGRSEPDGLAEQLYQPDELCRVETARVAESLRAALTGARGDYVVLVDADTRLAPEALYLFAETLQAVPHAALLYADEDGVLRDGSRVAPWWKPPAPVDSVQALRVLRHVGVYRRSAIVRRGTVTGDTWADCVSSLIARVAAHLPPGRIVHVPFVLAHLRVTRDPASHPPHDIRNPNVREIAGTVSMAFPPRLAPPWRLDPDVTPSPGWWASWSPDVYQDMRNLDRITELASGSRPAPGKPGRAGGSVWRRGAAGAFVFLRESAHVDQAERVVEILDRVAAQHPEAGVLGAVAHDVSGRVVGGALDFERSGPLAGAPRPSSGLPTTAPGNVIDVPALTSPCMMVRASLWEDIGGFDERLGSIYRDAAFCLSARRLGHRCLLVSAGPIVDVAPSFLDAPDLWPDRRRFLRKWGSFVRAGLA